MRFVLAAALGLCACVPPAAEVNEPAPAGGGPGMAPEFDLAVSACTSTAGLPTDVPDGPPPIAGGTLIVLSDHRTAVASDPDDDLVWVADTVTAKARAIALSAHDEPGRLAVDAAGMVHVVLRRGGAVATIDPVAANLIRRDAVCPAPRGIAYDAAKDQLHVACMSGELISLPAAGGAAARSLRLEDDLRDVLVINGAVLVTRFRSAEVLTLAADGTVMARTAPQVFSLPGGAPFSPSVAWRTIATPSGGVAMLHQRATTATIDVSTGPPTTPADAGVPTDLASGSVSGYGEPGVSNCTTGGSVVQSVVSVLSGDNPNPSPGPFSDVTLAVDVAVTPDGAWFGVVSPATGKPSAPKLVVFAASDLTGGDPTCTPALAGGLVNGEPVAVAALDNRLLLVQTRNPPMLTVTDVMVGVKSTIQFPRVTTVDVGHQLFHMNAGANIACASCHPEGGEDGRVWAFNVGPRRTMPLRGGLRGTEPFHWSGDEDSFATLMADVFSTRMHAGPQNCAVVQAFSDWLESIPVIPPSVIDAAAVARGDTLFHDASIGCASCHSGTHFTNNLSADVGTGEIFQVPRLTGLGLRAPYLHDGRAATLKDRFTAIGGGDLHGHTSELSASQVDDLVAYLSTL